MYSYTAYELGIHSELPLPGLIAAKDISVDVVISQRRFDKSEESAPRNSNFFVGVTTGIGTFLVRSGEHIVVDPFPGVDDSLVRTILLGPIMAVLLRQRGLAVLHASGVGVNGGAIAFLGQSGWGKSTLAEAFYERGYGVVTDDLMAIRVDGSYPHVSPGYPSIKLFPDAAVFLGCDIGASEPLHSQTEKRIHFAASRFPQNALPLQQIYVLGVGERAEIEALEPREAFWELVRNSRAVSLLRDPDSRHKHLHHCARIAADVPTFRLRRRLALSALPELIGVLEENFA